MNSTITFLLKHFLSTLPFIYFLSTNVISQPWTESLPMDREAKARLTLFDYQEAFNNYWAPYNVENAYYLENGVKQKAGGWKQFKRWEWYWESRVNPITREFPQVSALEIFKNYKLENGGERSVSGNWTSMGPTSSSGGYAGIGRLNCVAFDPNDNNLFYAGAASGGVWKTTDGGSTWSPIGDFNDALGVCDIVVVNNGSDDILYLATGDRDASDTYSVGVLKSTDGGSTWNVTGLSWTQNQGYIINRLLIDPNDDNTLYTASNGGVYKTSNAGGSWTQITSNVFKDLEFNPGNSSIIYGSTVNGEIYLSTNSGSSWTRVLNETSGRRTQLAVSSDNNSRVYALMANASSALYGIYKSTDDGANFTQVFNGAPSGNNLLGWNCDGSGTGGQGWYDLCIISDPNDADIVFIGGVNTWKSTDGGSTWNINNHWSSTCSGQATTVHADKHYFAYQNGSSTLFECNDGGIYKTTNSGSSWTDITNTMVISQIYRLGVAQSTSDDVIIGLQDNGTKNFETNVWDDVIGGDGMECIIDYTDENTQYGSLYYGKIKRTTNHWGSNTTILDGNSSLAAWVTPYAIDPNNNQTLYVGYKDVMKSTTQGNSWTTISSWGGSKLQSLAVAPSNSDYIYTATYSTIYKTTNGGGSWLDITSNLPVASVNIKYISVKEDNPDVLWVSLNGFNTDGVYQSTNGGASWTNISNGLPQLPVNCVIQNKLNTAEDELYAGTDVGVYVKSGNADWAAFYSGLPNVVVNELDIYYDNATPANSLIRAATYGRGLWESDLYSSTTTTPVADFEADNINPSIGETVNFTDLSINTPTSWLWVITPDTYSFSGGTDENSQNPIVIFDVAGFYTISLTASNSAGSNTETKTDYIEVSILAPVADFEVDNSNPFIGETVNFTDLSTNAPTSWLWVITPDTYSFTGGTDENSQNPSIIFDEMGFYTISLTATNSGGSDTETKTDYIEVSQAAPVADFEADNLNPNTIEIVNFVDLSSNSPTSWLWDITPTTFTFLSGTDENSQTPIIIFNEIGFYTISLTATNSGGSDTEIKTDYIEVSQTAPVADFEADNVILTTAEIVNFIDLSIYDPTSWFWEITPATFTFLSGTDENSQNPIVIFNEAGFYTIALTATNTGGSDTETKTDYIEVSQVAPIADFEADNTSPSVSMPVVFTDLSINNPASWDWEFTPSTITFQSGTNNTTQNPVVSFDEVGFYTVSLTVTNSGGNDTETKTDYVEVTENLSVTATATPDEICIGATSQLHCQPGGGTGIYTFQWSSDPVGFTSTEQSPIVSPDLTTIYTVEVADGENTVSDDVELIVNDLPEITLGNWPEILCDQMEPPVQLTAEPQGGNFTGNVTSDGVFTPETAPLGWNVIIYTYEDDNSCENLEQDSIFVDNCVGIENTVTTDIIKIYPNPNEGSFKIESSKPIKSVNIINPMGILIYSETFSKSNVNINANFRKGIFFVKVILDDGSLITRQILIK